MKHDYDYSRIHIFNVTRWYIFFFFFVALSVKSINLDAQTTVNINPVNAQYGSGTIGGDANHNKYNGNIQLLAGSGLGTGNYGNGWIKFDLSSLPSTATITGVSVFYRVTASANNATTYLSGYSTTSGAPGDPAIATGVTLYSLCLASANQWASEQNANGDHTVDLGATAISYIQGNFVSSPLFTLTFSSSSSSITQSTTIAGYNHATVAYQPYLIVTYIDLSTSIQFPSLSTVNIFPNPFREELTIENSGVDILDIEIYDMLGKRVYPVSPGKNVRLLHLDVYKPLTIDLSTLNNGMYMLKMYMNGETWWKKIIKQ